MRAHVKHIESGQALPSLDLWSSVELGAFADELCRALGRAGVPCAQRFLVTKDNYWTARTGFGRLCLRADMYIRYPLLAAVDFAAHPRPPLSIVTSNTFYTPWLAARLAHRRRQIVHLVYDLYPDALVIAGKLRRGSHAERTVSSITRSAFRRSSANVFLGRRLLDFARQTYGEIPNAEVIPVGAPANAFRDSRPRLLDAKRPVTILYCGRLGRLHDADTPADWIRRQRAPARGTIRRPVRLLLHASGGGYRRLRSEMGWDAASGLEALASGDLVRYGGNLDRDAWINAMRSAEVALITLAPGAERVAMPSKTYSALVAGQAILAVCSGNSDLADLVHKCDCGWHVHPGDSAAFAHAVETIRTQPQRLLQKRLNGWKMGHTRYAMEPIAKEWIELIQKLNAGRTVATDIGR